MKKFISMAMALVMTLSLCTFVAAPKAQASFDDSDELSSQYAVQATEVIQKIEVMDGYDDNTFRPEAGLTRQAAAKIICNMILGPTTAKALPTNANPFPDVIAGNQFSGYISYCSQQGIISGYADGTFRPGDPLSGYAYLKMLLGALGYDQNSEGFVGDNWKVNVAKIALGIGLNQGISGDLDGTTQVTREEAAIYAFNTLQADMVEYDAQNTITVNGQVISMGSGKATPQTWNTSSTSANNINNAKSDGNNQRPIVQFAERYFDKLERWPKVWDTYTTDDFGRPSIRWAWKGVDIGTYSRDPDVVFFGNQKVNAIYDALHEETGMSSGDDTAYLYINSSIPNNRNLNVARANDKDLDHSTNLNMNATTKMSTGPDGAHRVDRIGDGTVIEVYRNDADNHVDVCVISLYGGKVDSVKGATAKKDAYVIITVSGDPNKRPDSIMNTGNREFETEDFDEDDVVAYTYSDSAAEIKDMYLMSSESGVLKSKVTGKSLNLDGTTYKYGKEYTFDDLTEANLSNKSSYVIYLFGFEDEYVLWVEEDEFSVDDYVLIERITIETTVNNVTTKTASVLGNAETNPGYGGANSQNLQKAYNQSKDAVGNSSWDAQAQVRYPGGARRTITLDDSKNYRTSNVSDNANAAYISGITSFDANGYPLDASGNRIYLAGSTGDDGNWIAAPFTAGRIVRVSTNDSGYRLHSINDARFYVAGNFSIRSNKILENGAAINDGTTTITADSDTLFVIEDLAQGTYKSYTKGIKNAPSVSIPALTVRDAAGNIVAGPHANDNATAYIYHTGGSAKLVFVTHAWEVSNSSNDIVFFAANSTSNLIESDDGEYYEVSAVQNNEPTTVRIKRTTPLQTFVNGAITFRPGDDATEKEYTCVILNNVSTDSNDFVTKGEWVNGDDTIGVYQGIRRVNDEEVRLNTAPGKSSTLKDVAENIRVYFVDGSDIDQIDYDEIVNDTQDWVYYVEDDDGEVTYLFIVDYEDDGTPTTTVTTYALNVSSALVNANYTVTPADGATSVTGGRTFKYQVRDNTTGLSATQATITSGIQYTGTDGFDHPVAATEEGGVWTVSIPTDIKDSSTSVFVYVQAKT